MIHIMIVSMALTLHASLYGMETEGILEKALPDVSIELINNTQCDVDSCVLKLMLTNQDAAIAEIKLEYGAEYFRERTSTLFEPSMLELAHSLMPENTYSLTIDPSNFNWRKKIEYILVQSIKLGVSVNQQSYALSKDCELDEKNRCKHALVKLIQEEGSELAIHVQKKKLLSFKD